jgi:hypothetical protein
MLVCRKPNHVRALCLHTGAFPGGAAAACPVTPPHEMPDAGATTGTSHHTRLHARASASAANSCAPALDEQRGSRGAVGSRLLRWQSDSAAKLITDACSRVVAASAVVSSARAAKGPSECCSARDRTPGAPVGSPRRKQTTVARCSGGEHWRTGSAQELTTRRSSAGGPRCERGRLAGQGRYSGGWRRTRPQTELAESEERDPPTGPARRRLRAPSRRRPRQPRSQPPAKSRVRQMRRAM